MGSIPFRQADFITSANKTEQYPELFSRGNRWMPELAVAGRSNVGKSSLLNHLFQRKNLVKTSATPGKTQLINFFTVDQQLAVADLPGYGFARVPKKMKVHWGRMIQDYLEARLSLQLILFLLDVRRDPTEEDKQFLAWLQDSGKRMILVFTKADKISKSERPKRIKSILQQLDLEDSSHVLYSTQENLGRKPLIGMINDAINDQNSTT
ncbi:MAG: YihA family ribosome biogenesis GTP-binding protein [Waddliaceae bacterium]|nr:YihA family ribosome biogenesis GTP-binding protein [Waddliaceae bacterium]